MFTFVVWAIGLYIMARLALFNLAVIAAAFEKHWFFGILSVGVSLAGWLLLLGLVFL